jgi:hypothetical protein
MLKLAEDGVIVLDEPQMHDRREFVGVGDRQQVAAGHEVDHLVDEGQVVFEQLLVVHRVNHPGGDVSRDRGADVDSDARDGGISAARGVWGAGGL